MKLQKFVSIILAAIMVLSLGITAFAADETETGSITINTITEGAVYEIYKLLDLESYNLTSGAYSYTVNAAWTAFFATEAALEYVVINESGYVSWREGKDSDENVANFAKKALAFAKEKGIAPVKSSKNDGQFVVADGKGVFKDLTLGYYLVDTNVGALCGLTTTNPNASVNAKNGHPTLDLQVEEDLTAQYGKVNSADIGQDVKFRATVHVHAGAQGYVFYSDLGGGFNFKQIDSISYVYTDENNETKTQVLVNGADYTFAATATEIEGKIYDIEVDFDEDLCETFKNNGRIIINYTAMLNRNAVIAEDGNKNTAILRYGDNETFKTQEVATTTYTYGFDIVKTDSQNNKINGAKFRIYNSINGDDEVDVVLMDDGVTYRRARADEDGIEIDVKGGEVRVVGFDNGTYYIAETVAPDGYNKIKERKEFIISDANRDAVYNDGIFSTGSGVHVINKTGSILPETGGIGTTLFYVIGGLLVGTAVVVLVSKKRMSSK